jgi:iron(III)-salmochelin esterase
MALPGRRASLLLSRRHLAMGTAALIVACQKRSDAAPSPASSASFPSAPLGAPGSTRIMQWTFDHAVSSHTAVVVPTWGAKDARFPVVIALHGRGEARKAPAEGAQGWPRDYALTRAFERVASPPLTPADFEGFVAQSRLVQLNAALAAHPFEGLIVACPFVPDLDLADDDAVADFGRFVALVLVPRLRRETPALDSPLATGIDGVSLGGALSLRIGLEHATSFGAVGGIQPALDGADIDLWTSRASAARARSPKLALRLLTSDGDYFRDVVRATSKAWRAAGIDHDFDEVVGPHDYPFNRGPGSIEMTTWHDRALRRGG